jgi:hypothetical protein
MLNIENQNIQLLCKLLESEQKRFIVFFLSKRAFNKKNYLYTLIFQLYFKVHSKFLSTRN